MRQVGRALDRGVGALSSFCGVLSAVLLVLMMLVIVVQVALRGAFDVNLNVAIELSGYAIAAITLLAAPYGLRSGAFIRVTIVYDRLRPRPQALLRFLFDCLGLLYVGLLTYYLWDLTARFFVSGIVSSTGNKIPQYLPLALVLLGAAVCFLAVLVEVARDVIAIAAGSTGRGQPAATQDDTAESSLTGGV